MTGFRCAGCNHAEKQRPDKEAFALLQQPFWLSAELGVLDCTAPTDEACEKRRTEDWEPQQPSSSRSRRVTGS